MRLPRSYLVLACLAGALIVAGAIIIAVVLIPEQAPVVGVAPTPVPAPAVKVTPLPVAPPNDLIWRDPPPSQPHAGPLPPGAVARFGGPVGPNLEPSSPIFGILP